MCINRVFYGAEAIRRIEEKKQLFSGQWMTDKEIRQVKKISMWKISKESFDIEALCQFVNLEVLEISGISETQPLFIKNLDALYQMKNLKYIQFECCNLGKELDTGCWKKLKSLIVSKCYLNKLKIGKNRRLKTVLCEGNRVEKEWKKQRKNVYPFCRKVV